MSNTSDKISLLDSFIEEVNSYLPEIETNLERLAQSSGDMDALEETYRRTHTIGGSASMMDFPGLAHIAHGMEDILGDALEKLIILDEPTIGLLRRSLGRVRLLLNGIRGGIKEDPIIAEDDADYEQYCQQLKLSSGSAQEVQNHPEEHHYTTASTYNDVMNNAVPSPSFEPLSASSSLPSFDEVLASFRTPAISSTNDMVWPEEPEEETAASLTEMPKEEHHPPVQSLQPTQSIPPFQSALSVPMAQPKQKVMPESQVMQSALDELVASTRKTPSIPPVTPVLPVIENSQVEQNAHVPLPTDRAATQIASTQPQAISASEIAELPDVYARMQEEAQSLENLIASFKQIATQLRTAIMIIEGQRTEFKSFLNGSKDALERMEDWAGRAMNLNLRNSPEQVRRYLPLSVMWVSNNKLRKVQDVLNQIANGTETSEEQFQMLVEHLQVSLSTSIQIFQQMQAQATNVLRQEPGWSAWEMQSAKNANNIGTIHERVTFERQGDLAALRTEIETQLRAELRHEYETRPITSTERVVLEQQIRDEVRREFESRQQLQPRVSSQLSESFQEMEERLRGEIEIQVRQEFLDAIVNSGADSSAIVQALPMPNATSFVDYTVQTNNEPGLPTQSPMKTVVTTSLSSQPVAPVVQSLSPTSATQDFGNDFGEEAAEIFRLEAEEHLQTISMNVAALEKSPTNRELIQGIRRATHTLKGAAGMMGFHAIADLCHVSEDLLDSIMEGTTTISPAVLSIILDTAEALDGLITGKGTNPASDQARVQRLRVRYTQLLGEQTSEFNPIEEIDAEIIPNAQAVTSPLVDEEGEVQYTAPGDLSVRVRLQKLDELVNLFGELLVNRSVLEERIQRLTRVVADVGLSSTRLRDVGQKLESGFEAATLPSGHSVQVMPGDGDQQRTARMNSNGHNGLEPAYLAEFDELELDRYTEFHRLARGLSEGISDMTTLSTEMEAVIRECENVFSRENRLSTTFQDRLMKVRLVPLSTMKPRLYRVARSVALKQHKEFEFVMEGEETEVDRTVYEEIAAPLLHLMRNAVNHAIETPEVRMQKGKPPVGRIALAASYESNEVVITVSDDGTGIDPEHVRNSAITRGLIHPDQVLNQSDLIELIFRPGFSTAEVLSEESGRGVGLDVVRDSVSRLRGTIEVESTPGQGTSFTMRFPTSMAIQSAMMIGVSDQKFAVPTAMVEAIGRLDTFKRSTKNGQPAVIVRSELYPLYMLAQYLSLPVGQLDERAQLLLINAGGQHVALVVDEIKGKLDIVMKSLGPHLRHVHGIAGGTVLGNGQVVLILELNELLSARARMISAPPRREEPQARQMGLPPSTAATPIAPPAPVAPTLATPIRQTVDTASPRLAGFSSTPASSAASVRGRYVLVVDDSPSVRRVVSSMLKQNGWEVQMARDGVEALEIIARETPAAVLLDIEMPRMDGYELIATVRAQEQYRDLPMIVLTSRAAAKHQQRAVQLGANDYVVKPYQDEELLGKLNALVFGTAVR